MRVQRFLPSCLMKRKRNCLKLISIKMKVLATILLGPLFTVQILAVPVTLILKRVIKL